VPGSGAAAAGSGSGSGFASTGPLISGVGGVAPIVDGIAA
jgi:hypothetical protein